MDQFEIRATERYSVMCLKSSSDNKALVSSRTCDTAAGAAAVSAGNSKEVEAENRRLIEEENARLAEKARGNKKAARSQIVFDVKPWEADTDLNELADIIRAITMEGVTWGEGFKIEPLAFGVNKLQVSAVVIDDLVSTELLMEKIQEIESHVQSVDIFAFNKL